ncbi:hypothetical protein LEP1GSC046_1751 [Leptospira kirschneri serovar Bim str. 1051]|nr:hypothetical protein LEP1GSC042_0439 [Leptospira kirschneri serovar Bim str. PUO 1247]EMN04671.1 hypothetical protein LEP1GSC046_1751 [Leptospira kirschneri serovar Bim str. 1051]
MILYQKLIETIFFNVNERERDRCEVNKLKLKIKYCITFLVYNLLTRAKEPGPAATGSRIRPNFLKLNSRFFKETYKIRNDQSYSKII